MTSFLSNPRLIVMVTLVTMLAGGFAFYALPRMEDPELTPRAAFLVTTFPGADAERVEALVTEKLEEELLKIEEIKDVRSVSRTGVSFVSIELKDNVDQNEASIAWTKVRDKADNAKLLFPQGAGEPEFEKLEIRAFAMILGLRWDAETPPVYSILRRRLKDLQKRIDAIEGTERTELFADPGEEVLVTIDPEQAAAMQLSPVDISQLIRASDAKVAAGFLRGGSKDLLLQVSGELDTLTRVSQIPLRVSNSGAEVLLGDIAEIEKSIPSPPRAQAILSDRPAVVLGALVDSSTRIDFWNGQVKQVIEEFEQELPDGLSVEIILEQSKFVQARMQSLISLLLQSILAVLAVSVVFMGLRASIVIGLTIPMTCLSVLAVMRWADIPIHQMSITGLIISLGLMIDASIITVDEIARRLAAGDSRSDAVAGGTRFMFLPLLNAGLTSILSFAPIAMMPGPAGEFVGAIGVVTIVAVMLSIVWSLTIIAALAGKWLPHTGEGRLFWSRGFASESLTKAYGSLLEFVYRRPMLGVGGCVALSIAGFVGLAQLPEQFFPPTDRSQFHLELEMPLASSISETKRAAKEIREFLLKDEEVVKVSWFLGDSAPVFFYNIIPDRRSSSNFGQAIVEISPGVNPKPIIARLQNQLNSLVPQANCLARQLEQGPAFAAPIEVRLFGPSPEKLRELGEQARLVLAQTPQVIATRSDARDSVPKVMFSVQEQQARMVGLKPVEIAGEMFARLEGLTGGSVLEGSEELPVKVRVADSRRNDLNDIASLSILTRPDRLSEGMQSSTQRESISYDSIPLNAISELELAQDDAGVTRKNRERMNEIQAYLTVGALPIEVQGDFARRLEASGFELPPGYRLDFGGASERRDDAVGNLIANTAVWGLCMVTVLVLSYNSFRMAAIILAVGLMAVGYALGSLWFVGLPWGFMAVVGAMGMIGAAVNDSIIVLMVIRKLPESLAYDTKAIRDRVVENSRHNWATTVTTVIGFTPLYLAGGQFWPPVAVTIAGGVFWATALSLFFVPCAYLLMPGKRRENEAPVPSPTPARAETAFSGPQLVNS